MNTQPLAKEPSPDVLSKIRAQKAAPAPAQSGTVKLPWKVTGRRFLAYLLDQAAFLAIGFLIASFAKPSWLESIGKDGWWAGLLLVTAYFTIMDSSLCGGQTLGKRIFGIRVRHASGHMLHPIESLIRYSPFIAITIIAFEVKCANQFSPWIQSLDAAVFLISISIPLLMLIHPQRRSVQDLISGSLVVRAAENGPFEKYSNKRPLIILAIVCVVIAGLAAGIFWYVNGHLKAKELASIWKAVENRSDICCATVMMRPFPDADFKSTKSIVISAYMPKTTDSRREPEIARQIYDSIPRGISIADDVNQVAVNLVRGFDLGITRQMTPSTHRFPVLSLRKGGAEIIKPPAVHYKVTPSTTQKSRAQKPAAPAAKGEPVKAKK